MGAVRSHPLLVLPYGFIFIFDKKGRVHVSNQIIAAYVERQLINPSVAARYPSTQVSVPCRQSHAEILLFLSLELLGETCSGHLSKN